MALLEIVDYINDNTIIDIYAADGDGFPLATYDGKDSIPNRYLDEEITDIFVDKGHLCIEIDIEPDMDYYE